MGGRQARALCPGLIIVRPRFDAYVEASKAVFELFRQTTPLVQGVSIDEAFLDVGGLHRIDVPPVDIGARLRARVRDEVGLPITVGVARTPFLAKVASPGGQAGRAAAGAARRRGVVPAPAAGRACSGASAR